MRAWPRPRRRGDRAASVWRGWPWIPVTTHPAASAMAMGAAKCTLSRRSPSWTYAARRPAASQVIASVLEPTLGLKSRRNVASASRCRASPPRGWSRSTSTSSETGSGATGVSAPSRRTRAALPSVQKTSPLIGSALAAASTRPSARSATLTATSGVVAAKLRVPHSGSTSHSRAAPDGAGAAGLLTDHRVVRPVLGEDRADGLLRREVGRRREVRALLGVTGDRSAVPAPHLGGSGGRGGHGELGVGQHGATVTCAPACQISHTDWWARGPS